MENAEVIKNEEIFLTSLDLMIIAQTLFETLKLNDNRGLFTYTETTREDVKNKIYQILDEIKIEK